MKAFTALFALVAAVAAEADPALLYSGFSGYSGYSGLGYSGLGYNNLGYAGLPYAGVGYSTAGYRTALPYVAGVPAAYPAIPGGYAAAGRYVANSAGIVHLAKREAEAEPEADPALLLSGYSGYSGLNYGLPFATTYAAGYAGHNAAGHPALKAAPCVNAAGVPQECANTFAYAHYPYAATYSGAHHIGKRDAEADPALLAYNALPYHTAAYPYAAAWNPVYSGHYAPHGVAATPFGYTHSSNVGVCTNYKGEQVPC